MICDIFTANSVGQDTNSYLFTQYYIGKIPSEVSLENESTSDRNRLFIDLDEDD